MQEHIKNPVAQQYETYPYPVPADHIEAALARGVRLQPHPLRSVQRYWPEGLPRRDLAVLVAGCGTTQAAHFAYTNPECDVTGIDLSETSLSYQRGLKEKHGIDNLALRQLNLTSVERIGRQFDLIICTGVLHHLPDPDAGLRALRSVVLPQGHMSLMVYAKARRSGIYLLQDAFRRLGAKQDQDGIRLARAVLAGLPAGHFAKSFSAATRSDADIVDMFLHTQDVAYSVPDVLSYVERCGLRFAGWNDNGLYFPDRYLSGSNVLSDALDRLPDHEQWAVIENLSLAITKHDFFACRDERKVIGIDFQSSAFLNFVPHQSEPDMLKHEDGRYIVKRAGTLTPLAADEAAAITAVNGISTVAEIASSVRMPAASARTFFARMWRLGHLTFSLPA